MQALLLSRHPAEPSTSTSFNGSYIKEIIKRLTSPTHMEAKRVAESPAPGINLDIVDQKSNCLGRFHLVVQTMNWETTPDTCSSHEH